MGTFDDNLDNFIVPSNWNRENHNKIKVIGVGGAGCNVVTHVYHNCVNKSVDYILFNTDPQSLNLSDIPHKVMLGKGIGAGCKPEVGKAAAVESQDAIKNIFSDESELIFIAAGMGGGTGTGAGPYIAKLAKEAGKVVVGVVTFPARDEGRESLKRASQGLDELKKHVNSLIVIDNQKIYEMYGGERFLDAFGKADDVMVTAVKSILDIITTEGKLNVDLADIMTIMESKGIAIMGVGEAEGEDRAARSVEMVFQSPFFEGNDLSSAKGVIVNITTGAENGLTMIELQQIVDYVNSNTNHPAKFKRGIVIDSAMKDRIRVTVVATGFKMSNLPTYDYDDDEEEGNVIIRGGGIVEVESSSDGFNTPSVRQIGQDDPEEYNPKLYLKPNGLPVLILESGEDRTPYEKETAYRRRMARK